MVLVEQSRRSYQRVAIGIDVGYRIGADWAQAPGLNLSAGGLMLRVPPLDPDVRSRLLAERDKVCLALPLQDRTLHVTARVAWCDSAATGDGCLLGLKFLDLPTVEQEFVWRWVLDHAVAAESTGS